MKTTNLEGSLFFLGVDSPFFSTIVLFKSQLFPWVFDDFLKRRILGKNGEGSPGSLRTLKFTPQIDMGMGQN